MLKIVVWKWKIIIIWDHTRWHASKNPVKKPKNPVETPNVQDIYQFPMAGE